MTAHGGTPQTLRSAELHEFFDLCVAGHGVVRDLTILDIGCMVAHNVYSLQRHFYKLYCCRKVMAPDASSKFLGVKATWKTGVALVVSVFRRVTLEVSLVPGS